MNLYVSNLGEQITDESLHAIFSTHGAVASSNVIKDQFTGNSRGFGFVDMPNEEEASNAIFKINGAILDGRIISVEEASPMPVHKGSYPARTR